MLRDCRKPDHDIIAIANGHVSGPTIGAPRSSTYFIREEGKLVGQLCVNIDMTPYEQVMESLRQLSGMGLMNNGGKSGIVCSGPVENFSEDVIGDMMKKAVITVVGSSEAKVRERLTQKEKIEIIGEMKSVYRYQSKLQKKS